MIQTCCRDAGFGLKGSDRHTLAFATTVRVARTNSIVRTFGYASGASGVPAETGADPTCEPASREDITRIQFALEKWIGARQRATRCEANPFKATAVFHTPKPCTPLLVQRGRPVPPELISPAHRNDPEAVESVARRVVSVPEMADAGANVVVCYPQGECDNLPPDQRLAYDEARKVSRIIDFPAAPTDKFKELSGATYIAGTYRSPYDVCVSVRLVQARAIPSAAFAGPSQLSARMALRSDPSFAATVTELRNAFGFCLETIH
ncbi:MAG TPA: hypothetical protein VL424_04050 [Pararobbsia sp.]|nr:hypothetical protein [Pararobbsia sp.]